METEDIPTRIIESLQHLAAVRIVASLCHHSTIRSEIINFLPELGQEQSENCWKLCDMLRNKIKTRVLELSLPTNLSIILSDSVNLACTEISEWILFNNRHVFNLDEKENSNKTIQFIDKIVWQSEGIIDYASTARSLVNVKELTAKEKFKIISSYCLEDLLDTFSLDALKLEANYRDSLLKSQKLVQYYWLTLISTGSLDDVRKTVPVDWSDSFQKYMLTKCLMDEQNLVATEYFWNFLIIDEKIECVSRIASLMGMRATFALSFINETGLHQELLNEVDSENSFFKNVMRDVFWRRYLARISNRFSNLITIEQLDKFWIYFRTALMSRRTCNCIQVFPAFLDFWKAVPRVKRTEMLNLNVSQMYFIFFHLHDDYAIIETSRFFDDIDYTVVKKFLFSDIMMNIWQPGVYAFKEEDQIKTFIRLVLLENDAAELIKKIDDAVYEERLSDLIDNERYMAAREEALYEDPIQNMIDYERYVAAQEEALYEDPIQNMIDNERYLAAQEDAYRE